MTLLAGIWHRHRQAVPAHLTAALDAALSRSPTDIRQRFDAPGIHLAKIDIGAFGDSAWAEEREPHGRAVTLVTGEPLMEVAGAEPRRTRSQDTEVLHRALRRSELAVLRACAGQFVVAHYSEDEHRLVLATDLLGVRPLYVGWVEDFLVFASAMRVLLAIPGMAPELDARGATEVLLLKAPLQGRSTYRGVRLLAAAECLSFTPAHDSSHIAERWDEVPVSFTSRDAAVQALHGAFVAAVRRRARCDQATAAFLSGGLDSRLVVTTLRSAGLQVRTLNFSLEGSLDHTLGQLFASAAGTTHESHPYRAGLDDAYPDMASRALARPAADGLQPERPSLVWAGFGGSAIIGQGNVWPDYLEHCRAGNPDAAADSYIRRKGAVVPGRLFRPAHRGELASVTRDGIRAELVRFRPEDPGRLMDLYLLTNATRAQLHAYFDVIDVCRLEHQLPFFDADFVRTAQGIPIDWLQRHDLYHQWLPAFDPVVTAVPWQAYPGHLPCPMPAPAGSQPQWQIAADRGFRRQALRRASLRLLKGPLPFDFLDRAYVTSVSVAQLVGVSRYGYAVAAANSYMGWWKASGCRPVPLAGSLEAAA
ncbi:MAG TPA: asparagine synthase-related protein [Gemmatimonadales bacterium]|nr:asparagine synthase-related protein [Gemmatimonadales bacterium]